jgi:hypothetical protein
MNNLSNTPTKLNVPLSIVPCINNQEILQLYSKLPEHMHEEHKKEFLVSNQSIQYDLRSPENAGLPNTMTELYNAGVYGQLTTSLIDTMIIPTTHTLDLKAIALDKEVSH